MSQDITTVEVYKTDLETIEANRLVKREANRDSLHRLIMAGDRAIKEAEKAAKKAQKELERVA